MSAFIRRHLLFHHQLYTTGLNAHLAGACVFVCVHTYIHICIYTPIHIHTVQTVMSTADDIEGEAEELGGF